MLERVVVCVEQFKEYSELAFDAVAAFFWGLVAPEITVINRLDNST